MKQFQNYHSHKEYTNVRISDSTAKISQYGDRALELGHGIISSVEHGWQGNYWETIKESKSRNLKPLIGAEAYWVKDRNPELKDNSNCHICLLAMNENGRRALNNVLSEANISGFYTRPRVDLELIHSLPADDIICTTACVAFWKYEDIDNIVEGFRDHFRKNFYLEVQYHMTDSQRELNSHIMKLHDQLKIPIIMGCDSHFILPQQAQDRTDFIFSKGIEYPEETGWFLDYPDWQTAYDRFAQQGILSHSDIIDAMENTNVFLDVKEYDCPIFDTSIKMPSIYPSFSQQEKDDKYRQLVWSGWDAYKHNVPEAQHEMYEREIQSEIDTVVETKMSDYFVLNHAIIKKGKENGGWLTKSGRGSAVSFITNMLLGFTEVDRIAASVKMYPERFMSATRILETGSLPD